MPTAPHHSQSQSRDRGRFAKKNTVEIATQQNGPVTASGGSNSSASYNPPYTSPVNYTPQAVEGIDGRFSRPSSGSGLDLGTGYGSFLGVVARRGWDTETLGWLSATRYTGCHGLNEWGQVAPLILLRIITYLHPLSSQALGNNLDLAFAPDDISLVAVETVERPDGSQSEKVNSEGTAALNMLWDRLDTLQPEIGGWRGLMRHNAKRGMDAGMAVIEGVPSRIIGDGVQSVYTIDPLTIRFRDTNEGRVMEQRQMGSGQPVRLPRERVFFSSLDGDTDNPYGEPLFRAFPSLALTWFRHQGNLSSLIDGVIYPRLSISFPLKEITQWAIENAETALIGKGVDANGYPRDLTPSEFGLQQLEGYKQKIKTLQASDTLFTVDGGRVDSINLAAGLTGMDSVAKQLDKSISSSLHHPATMLNIEIGGTQGLGNTNWRTYAKLLESLRAFAADPVLQLANLHLRLMGLPFVARMKAEKIETDNRLADAQADALFIANTIAKRNQNWISNEEASIEVTGSGPFDDPPVQNDPNRQPDPNAPKETNVPPEDNNKKKEDTGK